MSSFDFVIYALMFAFGSVIGSFLNVCIYRIPIKKSISFPPSSCTSCERRLSPFELIPVLSYLFLKGRCRGCSQEISVKYPLVELLTGFMFLFEYGMFGFSALFVKYAVLSCILIVVSLIDIEHQIIPDEIVVFSLAVGIILNIFARDVGIIQSAAGFVAASGILLLIALATKGGMGGGDVKLMAAVGLFIGAAPVLLGLFLSFILGGAISSILLLLKIKDRKEYIPFGPFLAVGSLASALFYDSIMHWYVTRFFI